MFMRFFLIKPAFSAALDTAYKFNITFYDAAYLAEAAQKFKITLVTDDKKNLKSDRKRRSKNPNK